MKAAAVPTANTLTPRTSLTDVLTTSAQTTTLAAPTTTATSVNGEPLYRQLAQKLAAAIAHGALRAGDRLPSVRLLSRQHGVSISTALAAYRDLENSGLIEARPKSGYFVATPRRLTQQAPVKTAKNPSIAHATDWPGITPSQARFVRINQEIETILSMSQAVCRIRLDTSTGSSGVYPTQKVQRLMNTVARRQPNLLVEEAKAIGHISLRTELSKRAVLAGMTLRPDDILITNGVTEALNLALRAVAKPGDTIAVESPTFFGILQILESLGMKALEIPTHPRDGISIEALDFATRHDQNQANPIKALIVMSNFHNPLGSLMPDQHKARMVNLMAERGIPVIEDDWSGDLYFTDARPLSLKAWDKHDNIILCSSATKPIAPGLRIGWMVGARWQKQLEMLKFTTSIANSALPQVTIAEFIRSGGYDHHLRKLRGLFRTQTQHMAAAIDRYFPAGTQFSVPQGGALLWIELPPGQSGQPLSSRTLYQRTQAEGIGIGPGVMFSNSQQFDHFIRLYCGGIWDFDLDATIQRLGQHVAQLCEES